MDLVKHNKKIFYGLFLILWLYTAISFILVPFNSDLKVFMSSANQSHYISDNLVLGAYKAWELKSVFSRLTCYLIYKMVTPFASFATYGFEVGSKIVYLFFMLIIILISMQLLLGNNKEKVFLYSGLMSLAFTGLNPWCHMQVEMTAVILLFLAFSLYVSAVRTNDNSFLKLFFSGMLIGSLFYYKSVLILLSVSVVSGIAIFCLSEKRQLSFKRMLLVAAGSFFIILINLVAILIINPTEIQDILDAAVYQSTLLSTPKSFVSIITDFFAQSWKNIKGIPVLVLGVVALAYNVFTNASNRQWKMLFFHCCMWMMPILFVVLSNRYFLIE